MTTRSIDTKAGHEIADAPHLVGILTQLRSGAIELGKRALLETKRSLEYGMLIRSADKADNQADAIDAIRKGYSEALNELDSTRAELATAREELKAATAAIEYGRDAITSAVESENALRATVERVRVLAEEWKDAPPVRGLTDVGAKWSCAEQLLAALDGPKDGGKHG